MVIQRVAFSPCLNHTKLDALVWLFSVDYQCRKIIKMSSLVIQKLRIHVRLKNWNIGPFSQVKSLNNVAAREMFVF